MPTYRNSREEKKEEKKKQWEYRVFGMFYVFGRDPKPYTVDIENSTCNCESWNYDNSQRHEGKRNCKHLNLARDINKKAKESFKDYTDKESIIFKNNSEVKDRFEYFMKGYELGINQ